MRDKTIKFIAAILIVGILSPSVFLAIPKKAEAFWFSTWLTDIATTAGAATNAVNTGFSWTRTAIAIKNVAKEVLRQAAMAVARRALQEMTKSTVNWINSGFHGRPLFLENPDSFFRDIAKYEVRKLVDQFGYDLSNYPFGREWALNTINAYKRQLADNASYSLGRVTNDPVARKNYLLDFNTGGWNAFLINTQYPQNNYFGFTMIANEELARRIENPVSNKLKQVQNTLQQGQGFLSPKMCLTNENYNDGINEFKQPEFNVAKWEAEFVKANPKPACGIGCIDQVNAWAAKYREAYNKALAEWNDPNKNPDICPNQPDGTSGYAATTPGSVVANQIMTSMSSHVRQSELGAALGNSLSAIFDALLTKFLNDGLNSLASKANPRPQEEDNWSYEGLTLGSPGEGGSNFSWDQGPETAITLSELSQTVEIGISATTKELQLIDQILGYLSQIWPAARELDICVPGPDLNWEDRLNDEMARNSKKLQDKINEESGEKSAEADLVLKELKFAVKFFEDWIHNKMMLSLPSSILFIDGVNEVETLSQRAEELAETKRTKTQALARLQALKIALTAVGGEPEPGSPQERVLISLKKQYDAIRTGISTVASVDESQVEVDVLKDRLAKIKGYVPKCEEERVAAGWGVPGGAVSSYSGPSVPASAGIIEGIPANSEQAMFCNLPIVGGYTHESFVNKTGVTHPEIPMVNAEQVLKYKIKGGFLGLETENRKVDIKISCNIIFKSTTLDYKGELPGLTPIIESTNPLPNDTGGEAKGTCQYEDGESASGVTRRDCIFDGGIWVPDSNENDDEGNEN